jgi:hypothetical protein
MKRMFRGLALTAVGFSLAACGASKFYTLPADPSRVSETQTMIGACASEAGLESYKADDFVSVKYDETAALYYRYGGDGSFAMQIIVDDKKVPGSEVEKKHAAAKARGDDIYACAQERLYPPRQRAPVVMVPVETARPSGTTMSVSMNTDVSVGVSASVTTSMSGRCAQAFDCYAQLAKTVCEGASDCSFKAEISGNDEAACRDALLRVNDLLQPFRMMRPGLSAPAICRAE